MRHSTFSRRFFTCVTLLFACGVLAVRAQADDDSSSPVHQLRIYEIFESNKSAFHQRFRDHATRIMAK